MTTRQKQRQAELESRMKMWGVDPVLPSIHDDECGLIEDRIALAEYADWKDYANPDPPVVINGKGYTPQPGFNWLNVLLIATCVVCAAYLIGVCL